MQSYLVQALTCADFAVSVNVMLPVSAKHVACLVNMTALNVLQPGIVYVKLPVKCCGADVLTLHYL